MARKAISSAELKAKVDPVEKVKLEISKMKNPQPEIIKKIMEKGTTSQQAMDILQLAINNKLDSNEVYSGVLDILFSSMSPLAYDLNDLILREVHNKQFSGQVLGQLLSTMIQLRSEEKAFAVLEVMLRMEKPVTSRQFGMLGEIYAEKHKWDDCFKYMDFMVAHQTKPDGFTFNVMWKHFSRHAPIPEVERLKERMEKEGVLVSKHVYWNLQETYARYGVKEKVIEMYEKARREVVHPYITMITQYGKWGEPEKAAQVLEVMKDDLHTTGLTPGLTTYTALAQAFTENKRFEMCLLMMDRLKKDKSKYGEELFSAMIENGLKFKDTKFIIDTHVRMRKLNHKCPKHLEKRVAELMAEKNIDLTAEVRRIYNSVWPELKYAASTV